MRGAVAILALLVLAVPATAQVRPIPRPAPAVEAVAPVAGDPELAASDRPTRRASDDARPAVAETTARPSAEAEDPIRLSARPASRPTAPAPAPAPMPAPPTASASASVPLPDGAGGLCGRASLRGEAIAPVQSAGGCGIDAPVAVTAVAGLALSTPARMDCPTAVALDAWVRDGVIPAIGRRGGGPVALQVAGSYVCRTRNHQPGARMSEHGRGRAIDISAIRLADGSAISVERDWGRGTEGQMLAAIRRAACGPFGTVLGPGSDPFHDDHLHLDTARERRQPYCR